MANGRSTLDSISAWAYIALGLSLVAKGYVGLKRPAPADGLVGALGDGGDGEGDEAEAMRRAGGVIVRAKVHTVANIAERVAYIADRIRKDSLKPEVREKALAVLSRKCKSENGLRWCVAPKDYVGEIKALFRAVQDANSDIALRYVRDHIQVDQFTAADKLIRIKGGDCDDGSILLGAMLRSVGYPVKLRVIQDTASSTWSHIYPSVGLPPQDPTKWVPLDWSVYPFKPAGWEAPGAEESALSGRPAGIVTRVRDFEV